MLRLFMQLCEAMLAPEIESDTTHRNNTSATLIEHFHSGTVTHTVKPVMVWQGVRDVI
jgi:hypothetical protein